MADRTNNILDETHIKKLFGSGVIVFNFPEPPALNRNYYMVVQYLTLVYLFSWYTEQSKG